MVALGRRGRKRNVWDAAAFCCSVGGGGGGIGSGGRLALELQGKVGFMIGNSGVGQCSESRGGPAWVAVRSTVQV